MADTISKILIAVENSGAPVIGIAVQCVETTALGSLQWKIRKTGFQAIIEELCTVSNAIPGVSQCTTKYFPNDVSEVYLSTEVYVRGTDNKTYRCTQDHTSSDANRPITGGSYSSCWEEVSGVTGAAWERGRNYKQRIPTGANLFSSFEEKLIDLTTVHADGVEVLVTYEAAGVVMNYFQATKIGPASIWVSTESGTEKVLQQEITITISAATASPPGPDPPPGPTDDPYIGGPTVIELHGIYDTIHGPWSMVNHGGATVFAWSVQAPGYFYLSRNPNLQNLQTPTGAMTYASIAATCIGQATISVSSNTQKQASLNVFMTHD